MDLKVTTLLLVAASFCDVTSGDALADPGLLRVPRIYNALITTNKKLEPSRAFPHAAPVVPVLGLPPGTPLQPPPEAAKEDTSVVAKDGEKLTPSGKQYPLTFHPRALGYYPQPYYPYPSYPPQPYAPQPYAPQPYAPQPYAPQPYAPNPYYYNHGAGPRFPVQYPYPVPVMPVIPSSYKASQSSNVEMQTGRQGSAAAGPQSTDEPDYNNQDGGDQEQTTETSDYDNRNGGYEE